MSRIKDLKDKRFNRLIVTEEFGRDKWGNVLWKCICECGVETIAAGNSLISGGVQSCGCLQKQRTLEANFKDITGRKFGGLTVLRKAGRDKWRATLWFCQCECGTEKIIASTSLLRGDSRSCGCLQKQKAAELHTGEGSLNWKGGVTPLNNSIRSCKESLNWRLNVFARDGFKCQHCKDANGGNLRAHHKKPFAEIIQENNITTLEEAKACGELWDINNGITLCEDCHKLEHRKMKLISINKN